MIDTLKSFKMTRLGWWALGLGLVMAAGVAGAGLVFAKGLVVTNLSDLVPWGLWITLDLTSIALAAGAFLLCAVVYLLGLKQYEPVARTATFIGLIGYSMAMLFLAMDIGQPLRFWHGFVFWNTHSVLWEVTMCVGLYFTVLTLESMPIIARWEYLRNRWPRLAGRMEQVHHYAPYLAIAGLGLSMLHQSSLGATYGVLIARPIWYRPGLSVLFIVSAAAGGLSLTTLASMLAVRLSPKAKVNDDLLDKITNAIGWVLVGYLYFRFWDAFAMHYTYDPGRTEGLDILLGGPLSFNFWIGEILLGAAAPIVVLLSKRLRGNPIYRMLALACVIGGVVAYRWDTNLVGLMVVQPNIPGVLEPVYTHYFPSLVEIVTAAGVIAYGLLAFTLGVRYLRVVDHGEQAEALPEALLAPAAGD